MRLKKLTLTALFAAVICVMAPFSFPIGPIPISLATLAIYLAASVLGWKMGLAAVAVYVLLGMAGLPVFSNFGAGFAKLAGPTGGFIAGYLPCALIVGLFADRFERPWAYGAGMLLGTAALYAFGTVWYCFSTGTGLPAALGLCAVPFLPGDAIKIVLAALLAARLRPAVKRISAEK